jgi:hypothetical protein
MGNSPSKGYARFLQGSTKELARSTQGRSSNIASDIECGFDGNSLNSHTTKLEDNHKRATTDFNKITRDLKALMGGSDDFWLPIHWVLTPVQSRRILSL